MLKLYILMGCRVIYDTRMHHVMLQSGETHLAPQTFIIPVETLKPS